MQLLDRGWRFYPGGFKIKPPNCFILAVAACATSIKSPPRDPRDPTYHSWRGLVHTNHTRCAESRSGCIQRVSGPPSDPEIWHVALAAVPAANLGPGTRPEPAPTTHGGYGRNSTGSWLADDPQGVPPRPCMCGGGGGVGVHGESMESGGGAGRPVGCHTTSIPALHSCPSGRHRAAVNQDAKNQAVCSKYLPVRAVPLATPKRHGPF
jgi:hypothetical protein